MKTNPGIFTVQSWETRALRKPWGFFMNRFNSCVLASFAGHRCIPGTRLDSCHGYFDATGAQ